MSLKSKIFFGFSLSVFFVFTLFSIYTFSATTDTVIEKERETLEALSQSIYIQMEKQLDISRISAISLANNSEVQKLFAQRNRDALADLLLPVFNTISDEISQIQFHLPDSTSFLRLHALDKYGDSLKEFRFTVNEANEKREIISGLEEGFAGFGFRVVVPIEYESTHIGTVEYGSDFGETFLESLKSNYGGEYFIYQFGEDSLLSSTSSDNWLVDENLYLNNLLENQVIYTQSTDGNYNITLIPFKDYRGDISGYFKSVSDRTTLVSELNRVKTNAILLTVVVLVLVLIGFFIFLNKSFKPILHLIGITEKVSSGDLTQKIDASKNDEIGRLSKAFNKMTFNLKDLLSKSADVSEKIAATSQELSASSEEVTASSEHISSSISDVENSSNIQVNSIEDSNMSIDRMLDSMKKVANNIELINVSTKNTLKSAERGILSSNEAVDKINILKDSTDTTSRDINKLTQSSTEIEKILLAISAIAEQTNLLSLNAAIEAARAGEAGKGFSVVAEEVRKLAVKTTESSKQISKLISNIQSEIKNAVESMDKNKDLVEESVTIVNKSSSSFSDILSEIDNIARQMREVITLNDDVSLNSYSVKNNFDTVTDLSKKTLESVSSVAENSEEQTAAMEEIASSAMNLSQLAIELRDSISSFRYE